MMVALLLRTEWYKFLHWPRLAIFLLKLKNVYIWQLQWSAIHSKYKFCFLSQSSKCQNMVIKSLNTWSNWPENKNCFLGTKHSHNDVYKLLLLRNLFLGHMGFDFICWWNIILNMFTKIMGIYECSRDFLTWKMCSFT